MKIPERNENLKKGLFKMIEYLKSKTDIENKIFVEVGCWTGVGSEIFAKNFKHVICIDPWAPTKGINTNYKMSDVEKVFDNRMRAFDNVTKHKIKYEDAFVTLKCNYDFFRWIYFTDDIDIIYVDGCHTYDEVKKDIILSKILKPDFICGHDYWPKKFPGVIKAVNETLGKPDITFSDTSWVKEMKY
jgi:hypothetical protein